MQKRPKHLKVSGIVLGVLCMLASCAKMQTRRMYDGPIRPNADIVKVSVPDSVRVVSLNGSSTQEAIIEILGSESELHLLPGDHELGLRYSRTWDSGPAGVQRARSGVVTVALSARAGERYEIRLKEKIENYRQSKAFAAHPQFQVIKTGEASEASAAPVSILSDTVQTTATGSPRKQAVSPPETTITDSPSNLEQLKQIWENASEQERDAFIKSILRR